MAARTAAAVGMAAVAATARTAATTATVPSATQRWWRSGERVVSFFFPGKLEPVAVAAGVWGGRCVCSR